MLLVRHHRIQFRLRGFVPALAFTLLAGLLSAFPTATSWRPCKEKNLISPVRLHIPPVPSPHYSS